MLEIKMDFNELVEQINRWNINAELCLQSHKTRNERAVWIVGNHLLGLTKLDKLWVLLDWIDLDISDQWFGQDWMRLEYLLKDAEQGGLFIVRHTDYVNELGWHETLGKETKPDEAVEEYLGPIQIGDNKRRSSNIKNMPRSRIAPKRKAEFDSWASTWNYINEKNYLKLYAKNPNSIAEQFSKDQNSGRHHIKPYSADTIREIIRAGEAGELDM